MKPLGFYDHHRQSYAHMPLKGPHVAEFMVGGYYRDESGVDNRGEFQISLHDHGGSRPLAPRLNVFNDAYGALQDAIRAGLLAALEQEEIRSRDDLTAILVGLGFRDDSHTAVGAKPPRRCQRDCCR
jgi:hypothetical protein